MELREVLGFYSRYYKVILGGGFLLGLLTLAVSLKLPRTYKANLTLYVKRQVQPPGEFYSYDGYYAQQAAERYTRTVASLLKNPEIIKKATQKVGNPTDQRSLKSILRSTKVREIAPQLILLTVTRESSESARSLAWAISLTTMEKVGVLNKEGDERLQVELLEESPLLEEGSFYPILNGVVAFLVGTVLSVLVISFNSYLKSF